MGKHWVKGEQKYHFIYQEKVILVNVTQRPAESLILSPVMDRFIYLSLLMWDIGQTAHVRAAPVPCSAWSQEEMGGRHWVTHANFFFKNHKSHK